MIEVHRVVLTRERIVPTWSGRCQTCPWESPSYTEEQTVRDQAELAHAGEAIEWFVAV